MNPYLPFIQTIEQALETAKAVALPDQKREPFSADQKVLLFSPHPDDECITGLLPLRLMREAGVQVVNVPVTFGSDPERRSARAKELKDACAYLGWYLYERPTLENCTVQEAAEIITKVKPAMIFFPHAKDWNQRHISTHQLVMEALPKDLSCLLVETEYWGAMDTPNLMVQADATLLAELVAATSLHVGEVARNPYHLLLPAWMQDTVRRGAELVGGQGSKAPAFTFATLYRISQWRNGNYTALAGHKQFLGLCDNPTELLTD